MSRQRVIIAFLLFGMVALDSLEVSGQDKGTAGQDNSSAAAVQKVVKQQADGTIELLAIDSVVVGKRAKVEKKGANPHNIGFWTDVNDVATWKLKVDRAGTYAVEVEYSLDKRSEGSEYAIEFGEKKVKVEPKTTGTWLDFRKEKAGEVELGAGEIMVTVRPLKKPGQAVLDLRGIRLSPVK